MRQSKKVTIAGKLVDVVTVVDFAREVGKSVSTIKRYERQEILPGAILYIDNVRYYPADFGRKVAPFINKIPRHIKCPAELRAELNRLFSEERSKYACN